MEYIEVTGKSVEEAITNACTKLGIPSDKLDYEVIDKGNSGFLGIFNSKPAKIKAREKQEETVVEQVNAEEPKKAIEAPVHAEKKFEKKADNFKKAEPKKEFKAEPKKEFKKEYKPADNHKNAEVKEVPKAEEQPKAEPFTAEQKEVIKKDIQTFLNNMFGAMSMEVKADITFDDEENSVNVDLSGDNMGVLIGKRGQTLDSIQYLTSLVINKNSEKYVRVKLDTENYRKRRKETLESLAKNIAYKVKRSRRPVSLEPMNPYERRIIHSALQADKFVSTRSEGEEPFRHVVVYLERENNNRYNR
ncbi:MULTISPECIES: RNA-binding cell elongation regulator Jag/EloR [Clostridia]|jgi:spoIIIJ-associated protein|uniref:RNA-binding cell elongation regulator Jag/EloR n=1 Tax=Clostridia TaxID=186801 RepID=UPI000E477FA1|nr:MULTISPECIES: RNA-binding cell elongation regulator Jag/EloR [Clostridia]RGZ63915.1 KH domain-containing protein [Eubacterium sp. AM49-13BH]RGZ88488.1 KH domain-containing protein [Eubacterium sp. AM46-8]